MREWKDHANSGDVIRLLPVIVFTSVIFLIVGIHGYTMPLSQFSFMAAKDNTVLYDFFSFFKSVAIVLSAVAAAGLLSYYLIVGKRHFVRSYLYIPVCVYAVFIILSCILSDHQPFALLGSPDRFEGTIIHLCYLVIIVYAINCVDNITEVKLVIDTLFACVFIACIIGLTQLMGCDILSMGSDVISAPSGSVYQTVYNPNYVAFYLCLVIPLIIGRIADVAGMIRKKEETEKSAKIYLAGLVILLILSLINFAGASSAGSVPGLVFGVVLFFILRYTVSFRKAGVILLSVAYVCVAASAAFGLMGSNLSLMADDFTDRPDIEYIRTYDDTIEIRIGDDLLVTDYDRDYGMYTLRDADGNELDLFRLPDSDLRYHFEKESFNGIISFSPIIYEDRAYAIFETKDEMWRFEYTDNGVKYLNDVGNTESLDKVAHAGLISNYSFGSGRGYIWDTTLPLIKEAPVFGHGADTFIAIFPQEDYAVRYSRGLETETVYDKPHNMYLQMLASFGAAGLLAFASVILAVFLVFIKCKDSVKSDSLTTALFCGVAAFLISALVNDSSVSVMPMFYGLLGCACAVCKRS